MPREAWRTNQIAVTVAAGMVFFGFTLVMPFLPFYVESLGIEDVAEVALWSGLFMTVSPLLAALLGPFWGRLAGRVGMKIMVQRVLLTIALHWGLMYFAANVWHVLGLRVMLGLFSGFGTMSVALVTHGCPRDRIGRAVGVLQATQILSTALGPFAGGMLTQAIGIRRAFLATCLLCTAALLFVRLLYRDVEAATEPGGAAPLVQIQGPVTQGVRAVVPEAAPAAPPRAPTFASILALPGLGLLMPLLFFINVVDRSLYLAVPLLVAGLARPGAPVEAAVGAIMSLGALASAASAFVLGRRAAARAPAALLLWSLAASVAAILPMALCRSLLPVALLRVLLGLAIGGAATLAYTVAGGILPAGSRATGYALLSSVAMLGGAAGPILAGLLSAFDLRAPFVAGGLIYLALAAPAAVMARRHPAAPDSAPARGWKEAPR
jgi:DHA1 family multidrug resistance protein-like MFS transporter